MFFLDLSYELDFLRHGILISILDLFGINSSALKCLNVYILNRLPYVKFYELSSDPISLIYGIP